VETADKDNRDAACHPALIAAPLGARRRRIRGCLRPLWQLGFTCRSTGRLQFPPSPFVPSHRSDADAEKSEAGGLWGGTCFRYAYVVNSLLHVELIINFCKSNLESSAASHCSGNIEGIMNPWIRARRNRCRRVVKVGDNTTGGIKGRCCRC
jgi:hypothetical protein